MIIVDNSDNQTSNVGSYWNLDARNKEKIGVGICLIALRYGYYGKLPYYDLLLNSILVSLNIGSGTNNI